MNQLPDAPNSAPKRLSHAPAKKQQHLSLTLSVDQLEVDAVAGPKYIIRCQTKQRRWWTVARASFEFHELQKVIRLPLTGIELPEPGATATAAEYGLADVERYLRAVQKAKGLSQIGSRAVNDFLAIPDSVSGCCPNAALCRMP